MGTFTISRRGEDKAGHHQCLPKYGLLINPSWPTAFWKCVGKKAEEEGKQGDGVCCVGSAQHGLELEEPSHEPSMSL